MVGFSFGALARSLGWGVIAAIAFIGVLARDVGGSVESAIAATVIAAVLAAALDPIAPPGLPVLAASGAALLDLKGRPS